MRLSLLLLACTSIACSSTPEHRIDFPGEDPRNLGTVRITEVALERIEVENTGRQSIEIEGVALGNGWEGVLAIDVDSTGCVPGLTLAQGEHCLVAIAFEPANDVTYRDALHVDYRPRSGDPIRTTLSLQGTGLLDCSVSTELGQSYDEGVVEAEAQITADIAEATAAGAALTRDDGYADGYGSAYDAAYDGAYDRGRDDGFAVGYDAGYGEGASVAACLDGEDDGYADGFAGGVGDGEVDGAADGDITGYGDGYATGCIDGEFDSCGYNTKVDLDPSLPGKCVDQGYAATYSRSHYDEAFAAAVAANVAYQDGLATGALEGDAAGGAEGDADGYADGYAEGDALGFVDGEADQYETCYLDAFDDGYEDGYIDGYDALFAATYEAGFVTGYDDGYTVGFLICGG